MCQILRGFMFTNSEILTISLGLIFAFATYVVLMSSMIIGWGKTNFYKITEYALTESELVFVKLKSC